MPAYQTRLQARLQRAQDPDEKFKQEWEKRDIPPKPTRKGVWRLAKAGTRWKNISKNVADIPDMVVPIKGTPPLRVPHEEHSSVTSATAISITNGVQPMMEAPPTHFLSALGLQSCSSTATYYPTESSTVGFHSQSSATSAPAGCSTTGVQPMMETSPRHFLSALGLQSCSSTATRYPTESSTVVFHSQSSATSAPAGSSTTGVQPMMETSPRHFLSALGLQSCSSTATRYPTESSTVGFHSQSNVTGAPAGSSTTGVQPMIETSPRHFLSALGFQSCSSTATRYPTESSTVGLHSQFSVTGRPADPSTTDLLSDSEGPTIPTIEQYLQSPSAGHFEAWELEKGGTTQKPMIEAPSRHFISAIGLQSCSSTAACYPTESSTVGLHLQSCITGRPAEPSTTDLPEDSWNYTIEGLRIPRIEQFLRNPSAGCHGAGCLEEWGATQKPVIEVPHAGRDFSTQNSSTDVKALEQCTVKVPTSEPSAQRSSTGHFVTKPASRETATGIPSVDVTKPKEGPSTSQPLRKRVREENDSMLPMPPKKIYLGNTHDGPSVKCVQTGIKRKVHQEDPSEELTNVVSRRSSRKIKVPRRMDL